MKKPNLFIVGEPKSGTTALHNMLKNHPNIFMLENKEPRYFCKDLHEESDRFYGKKKQFPIRDESTYLSLFSNWKDEKYAGESTVQYAFSKDAAKNIFHFNPNSKIIIMFREPVEFLYSLHSTLYGCFIENQKDFKKAIELEEKRKKGLKIPPKTLSPSLNLYSERIKYSEHLQRFFDYFPKKNVKVIFFEEFKKENKKTYISVLKFLGLKNQFLPSFNNYNENKTVRFPLLRDMVEKSKFWVILKKILPKRQYKKISDLFMSFVKVKRKREKIDEPFRNHLMKKYKPEVIKLENLLKRKNIYKKSLLDLWGYE